MIAFGQIWARPHPLAILAIAVVLISSQPAQAQSDPDHMSRDSEQTVGWPDGIIPFDISRLTAEQQTLAKQAMQRWMDTAARIAFVPRTTQTAYVSFTGRTDAGNNTSQTGYRSGGRADINITAFWWKQGEWMPAHELGHALGFHHEHARWDRDAFVTIHYEHIKPGRTGDYDWIPKTNWLVSATAYDYHSIMHYRVCWASSCESQCHDADGASPCAVIDPVGTNYDRIIGQWADNKISRTDGEKARLAYGTGQTVYFWSAAKTPSEGTLEHPYASLTEARRHKTADGRIIGLADDGSFSIAP
jgi:hypothetical protein